MNLKTVPSTFYLTTLPKILIYLYCLSLYYTTTRCHLIQNHSLRLNTTCVKMCILRAVIIINKEMFI